MGHITPWGNFYFISSWRSVEEHQPTIMSGRVFFFILFSFLLKALCAPHTKVSTVNKELKSLGFKAISFNDGFETSLTCQACGVSLKCGKNSNAIWVLKRHTREKLHQIKAGWLLDDDNNAKAVRPKSKSYHIIFQTKGIQKPLHSCPWWEATWCLENSI